ncbi:MAG: hypothetical protein FWB85_07830 [Chitinispirillia bacterium]|nr:hypothetical protein [Chitinispirillia bacterium]MCL2242174.1 hypothetical protein [Chitinispirillia bacterium]
MGKTTCKKRAAAPTAESSGVLAGAADILRCADMAGCTGFKDVIVEVIRGLALDTELYPEFPVDALVAMGWVTDDRIRPFNAAAIEFFRRGDEHSRECLRLAAVRLMTRAARFLMAVGQMESAHETYAAEEAEARERQLKRAARRWEERRVEAAKERAAVQ